MPRISRKKLKWRARQKEGAIMRPATFKEIEREAAERGATSPSAVAGSAYWGAVTAKYKKRRKR